MSKFGLLLPKKVQFLDDEINDFFTDFLNVEVQLIRMPEISSRERFEQQLHF